LKGGKETNEERDVTERERRSGLSTAVKKHPSTEDEKYGRGKKEGRACQTKEGVYGNGHVDSTPQE